jgi:hypothetical protein
VFIQAKFHIGWVITAAVDNEAGQENIKVLYSSLKSTSAQIDVSDLTSPYYTFSAIEGREKATRGEVNGSQLKFLAGP